jgi:dihydroneopterin aldolase/2-amino-4-hydroxy-6-hydroxymethyldihydropteridine diphosphokinase/dihydropteroate synthase
MSEKDSIRIVNLAATAILEDGQLWPSASASPQPQPILVSLAIIHNLAQAAKTDNLGLSIDYGSLSSCVTAFCTERVMTEQAFSSIETLADAIFKLCFNQFAEIYELKVHIKSQNTLLNAKGTSFETTRSRSGGAICGRYTIEELSCYTVIGVHPFERTNQQPVILDVVLDRLPLPNQCLQLRQLDGILLEVSLHIQHDLSFLTH